MALNVWTQTSGYSFGIFQERQQFDQTLPVSSDYKLEKTKTPSDRKNSGSAGGSYQYYPQYSMNPIDILDWLKGEAKRIDLED